MAIDRAQEQLARKQQHAAEFLAQLAAAPAVAALDGARPIDRQALAALALGRARLGALWLSQAILPNGSFPYLYYPRTDTYDSARYNEVRHAGATYSLFQACQRFDEPVIAAAAESAAGYIVDATVSVPGGAAYVYQGRTKLGGQALALIALLERRRAAGSAPDAGYDDLIAAMSAFLEWMELDSEPGRYYQSYDVARQERLLTPYSDYYPGEALLALCRLARHYPDGPWLELAKRAATYLIYRKDGDIIKYGAVPRQDHWLAIALSELYQLDQQPAYATVAYWQADNMIASQIQSGDAETWQLGGARHPMTVNFTSTATRAEAVVAVWALAAFRQDAEAVERYSTGALRTIQFLMRVQYTAETTCDFPNPERTIGGWAQDITNPRIRLDFVQHNISALMGAHELLARGDPESAPLPLGGEANIELGKDFNQIVERQRHSPELDLHKASVIGAAQRRGIPVRQSHTTGGKQILEFGNGAYRKRFWNLFTSLTPRISVTIASDKKLTNQLLAEAGLPVPAGHTARTVDEAVEAAARIGYPVVLKPLDRNNARSTFVDLRDEGEVREHFHEAWAKSRAKVALVERYMSGNEYRVLVVDDQVAAAFHRLLPQVTGDGTQRIAQLIDAANALRRSEPDFDPDYGEIAVDSELIETLARHQLSLQDIPEAGQKIRLRPRGSRGGGAVVDLTGDVHPDNVAISRQAARILDLDIAGIDLITPDIGQSMLAGGGAIIEVNSGSSFKYHIKPHYGQPQDIGAAVIDMLFPPGQPVRVPIIAVTSSPRSTRICRLIAQILTAAGKSVGLATGEGLVIDGMHMRGVESRNPAGPRTLLNNPATEVAVVEVDPRDIIERGLGFDACDVAILTARHDDPGPAGLRSPEAVLIETVSREGAIVLDADDPDLPRLIEAIDRQVVLSSQDAGSRIIDQHRRAGGRAVAVHGSGAGGAIVLIEAGETKPVLPLSERSAPFRQDGLETALAAAIAAAMAIEIPLDTIRHALQTPPAATLADSSSPA